MDNDNNILYKIWLSRLCNHNPFKVQKLLNTLGSAREIYDMNLYSKSLIDKVGLKNILVMERNLDGSEFFLDRCRKDGIRIISIDSSEYPSLLKEIDCPPQLLYTTGNVPDLNKILGIAVVGTRKCTDDGKNFTETLCHDLAESGATIVSGMALGIDGAAHNGALSAGGSTIAVLAGGVDRIYPSEHGKLYKQIKEYGGILSERPPGITGKGSFYNERNRIIIGLCRGVIVVEGTSKSGTSLSVKHAVNSNRDIFAVPGNPHNPVAELPDNLIKDGAVPVTEALDIIGEYTDLYPEHLEYGISLKGDSVSGTYNKTVINFDIEEFLSRNSFNDIQAQIIRCFTTPDETLHLDYIAEKTGLNAGQIGSNLVLLQMKKAVRQSAGGQYSINRDL